MYDCPYEDSLWHVAINIEAGDHCWLFSLVLGKTVAIIWNNKTLNIQIGQANRKWLHDFL